MGESIFGVDSSGPARTATRAGRTTASSPLQEGIGEVGKAVRPESRSSHNGWAVAGWTPGTIMRDASLTTLTSNNDSWQPLELRSRGAEGRRSRGAETETRRGGKTYCGTSLTTLTSLHCRQ